MNHSRPRAFTLVEMLAVLAIIGIISSFLAPAISGMVRGGGLTTSGNTVLNLANYARQQAIGKNTMTALVLLGSQGTVDDYRALTVLEFDPVTGWSQPNKWVKLADGCLVDFTDTTNCTFLANSPTTFPLLNRGFTQINPPVSYLGNQVAQTAYAARIFMPQGGLMNPEQPAQLRVVEGTKAGTTVNYTNRKDRAQIAGNYYDVAIIGSTGTPKAIRP